MRSTAVRYGGTWPARTGTPSTTAWVSLRTWARAGRNGGGARQGTQRQAGKAPPLELPPVLLWPIPSHPHSYTHRRTCARTLLAHPPSHPATHPPSHGTQRACAPDRLQQSDLHVALQPHRAPHRHAVACARCGSGAGPSRQARGGRRRGRGAFQAEAEQCALAPPPHHHRPTTRPRTPCTPAGRPKLGLCRAPCALLHPLPCALRAVRMRACGAGHSPSAWDVRPSTTCRSSACCCCVRWRCAVTCGRGRGRRGRGRGAGGAQVSARASAQGLCGRGLCGRGLHEWCRWVECARDCGRSVGGVAGL